MEITVYVLVTDHESMPVRTEIIFGTTEWAKRLRAEMLSHANPEEHGLHATIQGMSESVVLDTWTTFNDPDNAYSYRNKKYTYHSAHRRMTSGNSPGVLVAEEKLRMLRFDVSSMIDAMLILKAKAGRVDDGLTKLTEA